MIFGIGTDIIETERVKEKIAKKNGLREFIFSENEIEYCESKTHKAEHYAARFAAKEAVLKALGAGIMSGLTLNEIEIKTIESGKPEICFKGETATKINSIGNLKFHVTLSHLKDIACAMVVIEKF